MQNLKKKFPGTIPRTPVFEEREVCFCSPKIKTVSNSNAEFKILPGDKTSDLWFMEEESLFLFSKNVLKLSYSNAKFKNFPGDITPDPRSRRKDSLFLLSKNVQKLSYSNAEFQIFPGDNTPDPRFWGEESLFLFSENQNSPSVIAIQNSKFFRGTKPRTFILGKRKVCFRFSKMY